MLNNEQLHAIALTPTGGTFVGIEAANGGKLTDDQIDIVRKAWLIRDLKRQQKSQHVKMGGADRKRKHVAMQSLVDWRECEDIKLRKRLEADPKAWLKYYLAETYTRKFDSPHIQIIDGVMEAHNTGGRFVVSAERGIGKSAVLWGMILYLKLSGQQEFPVCIPWAEKAKKQAFRFWKMALCFNPKLYADYPECCAPFVHAKGIAQRVMTTTWRGGPRDGLLTGAQLTVGEGTIVLPDMRGCIGGCTINGNPRGLNHPQESGTVLRPTIVLLDDVQDRKVAKSAELVDNIVHIIDGDVAGLGMAGKQLPILMSGNCITQTDVMAHFMKSREWKALKIPCIVKWPSGWDDEKGECRRLWDDWYDKFISKDKPEQFYRANKAVMTKGMELSAPSAFNGGHKKTDVFHAAMKLYYTMGHDAFMAERQQDPIDPVSVTGPYVIMPDMVIKKRTNLTPFDKPSWIYKVIASSDVNPSYGMSSVLVGFGQDQTAHVLWYGLHKCNIHDALPKPEFDKQLFNEFVAHGREFAAMPVRPEVWAIDCGGKNFDAVLRFAMESQRLCSIQAYGFRGIGWKNYNEYGKTYVKNQLSREYCHIRSDRKDGRLIKWVAWQSDYWKEIAQRAMLGEVNSPGSCSLPAGKHDIYAAQFCNEKLAGKADVGGKIAWNYNKAPGKNDFLDATAQAYALAAFDGIGTGGQSRNVNRPQQRRQIRHVAI